MNELSFAIDYLLAQSPESLAMLYWYVLIFEVPRFLLLFLLTALLPRRQAGADYKGKITVTIAGHSEADAIERCVLSLHEQSRPPDEIIVVSDGSSDNMRARMRDLLRRGLIDQTHATDLRAGKSAGVNMAVRHSSGDIIINVDCDCSFDRHAIRNILRPFDDANVAAVCGTIRPRNADHSIISRFQAIEYLVSISLGRQAADRIDQVCCVSGAFGAFRKRAYDANGGLDAGGGEDLDLTLRLRRDGWTIRFAADAICYTDVPTTLRVLVRQRFRWERDAVHLRYRKNVGSLNPFSWRFSLKELLNEFEFLLFNVIAAAVLPFYVIWLFSTYGTAAFPILIGAQIGLLMIDIFVFLMAAAVTPGAKAARLAAYVPGYSLFNGFFMRMVRLLAYLDEWIFHGSYKDNYVPSKVHLVRD